MGGRLGVRRRGTGSRDGTGQETLRKYVEGTFLTEKETYQVF